MLIGPTKVLTSAREGPSDLREASSDTEDSTSDVGTKSTTTENVISEENVGRGGKTNPDTTRFLITCEG
jgi:hypothetical protein